MADAIFEFFSALITAIQEFFSPANRHRKN